MSDPTVQCTHCGEDVPIDANRCLACGAPVLSVEKIRGMMVGVVLFIPIVGFTIYALTPQTITEGPGVLPVVAGIVVAVVLFELGLYSMYTNRKRAVEQAKHEAGVRD